MDAETALRSYPAPDGNDTSEDLFAEMKRFVRFDIRDEAALRALAPHALPHAREISEAFYARLTEHEGTHRLLGDRDTVERLKVTLCGWLEQLLLGPWDDAYFQRRSRIGRVHVRIGLPQRYMFGGMNVVRAALEGITEQAFAQEPDRRRQICQALARVLDLELCIILETYSEAYVDRVRQLERVERGDLEQRLSISEARYREIVETAEALIVTFDGKGAGKSVGQGALLFVNGTARRLLGAVAPGRGWFDLFVPAEHRDAVRALCRQILAGERGLPYEGTFRDASGRERRVRWHLTSLPAPEGPQLCAIGVDVTEESELAARARRAERLAALATMTAGLAHELRNPLNAAHLQLSVAERRMRATPPDRDGALGAVRLVDGEMKRLASLVEEFLDFSRPHPLRLTNSDLQIVVRDVLALLGPEAEAAGVRLTQAPGSEVLARVDVERIHQVLLNLVRNAVEATGRGGHVDVAVEAHPDLAILTVTDDGPGLSSSETRIFEPFFTTKQNGTGLGLAIVHRIVSDHEGEITVRRAEGRTVFAVTLPR